VTENSSRVTDPDRLSREIPPAVLVRPLRKVRQYRQFTEVAPTDEQIDAITDVARWSGSSRNSQPWRFIVIRDRDALLRIHEAGLPQTRSLATALVAIAIVLPGAGDAGRDPDDEDAVSYAYDEGRAAERMLIAASLLGLGGGIAWIMPHVQAMVAAELGLPEDRFVRTLVVVGNPTEAARAPKSAPGTARLPRENVVFEGRWKAEAEGR
jgi:nitroreductase